MSLKVALQYLLPQHGLSRLLGKLARLQKPKLLKNLLIRAFILRYGVNMTEAQYIDIDCYKNFNDFFTRALKPEARSLRLDNRQWLSPADGLISAQGNIENTSILQAKNHHYTVDDLLAHDEQAQHFTNGRFFTIYLAPKDYHRVHMPITGTLQKMVYVPGKLFSVNTQTTGAIPNLFAINERVISYFATEQGMMAIILVGAMVVASIATVWAGVVAPGRELKTWHYDGTVTLQQGQEMGHFQLGSTVIVLMAPRSSTWLLDHEIVKLGQPLASIHA